jgi:hypothetical protein
MTSVPRAAHRSAFGAEAMPFGKRFEANSCAKCAFESRKSCSNSNTISSSIDRQRSNLSVNDPQLRQVRSIVSQTIAILWGANRSALGSEYFPENYRRRRVGYDRLSAENALGSASDPRGGRSRSRHAPRGARCSLRDTPARHFEGRRGRFGVVWRRAGPARVRFVFKRARFSERPNLCRKPTKPGA